MWCCNAGCWWGISSERRKVFLCVSHKRYYIGPLRWRFSCIMLEKCQSQYFRKQMIVTKVIRQAQIQCPGFFHCFKRRDSLRKRNDTCWTLDMKIHKRFLFFLIFDPCSSSPGVYKLLAWKGGHQRADLVTTAWRARDLTCHCVY